jgi:CRP-like cAMP-binding protein
LQLRRLAVDAGVVDSRGRIIADRLTHEELARLIGASRVAVSGALVALRRSGHIAMSGRRFIVPAMGPGPGAGAAADSLVA